MRVNGVYEVVQKMHETEENIPVGADLYPSQAPRANILI